MQDLFLPRFSLRIVPFFRGGNNNAACHPEENATVDDVTNPEHFRRIDGLQVRTE